jgi:hypothetical protein
VAARTRVLGTGADGGVGGAGRARKQARATDAIDDEELRTSFRLPRAAKSTPGFRSWAWANSSGRSFRPFMLFSSRLHLSLDRRGRTPWRRGQVLQQVNREQALTVIVTVYAREHSHYPIPLLW